MGDEQGEVDDELDENELAEVLGLRGGATPEDQIDEDEQGEVDDELDENELAEVLGLHGGAAMKAMKKISARLAKRYAFSGKISKTKTGLTKANLIKTKSGKIVSKKKSEIGKKNPWIAAVNKARAAL